MKRTFLLIAAALMSTAALAQTSSSWVIAAAGDFYTHESGLSISWTLGETAINTLEGNGLILSQGFQQGATAANMANDLETIKDKEELGVSIYPNPASTTLYLRFTAEDAETMATTIEIFDITGQLLQAQRLNATAGTVESINVKNLPRGIYMVCVQTAQKAKVMKLVKE